MTEIPGLLALHRCLTDFPEMVVLTGTALTLADVLGVARGPSRVALTTDPEVFGRVETCYQHMMADIQKGTPVYGCNSGYGARAEIVPGGDSPLDRLELGRQLSRAISMIDVGVGQPFGTDVVRAGMLIRLNMLLGGVSAVKFADLELYRLLLERRITPIVARYGGLGASGDLAHNSRVLSVLRRLPGARVWGPDGRTREAAEALDEAGIAVLELDPKAGLAFTNGDNFSTGLAIGLLADTAETLLLSLALSALSVEVLQGSDRSFHPMLAAVRPHPGQQEASSLCRYLLEGSELAFQETAGHRPRAPGVLLQDAYSLRAVAQYHAVNIEKLSGITQTLTVNANSVSDNPLWVPPELSARGERPWRWVSGGNFLAAHAAEALDGLRKTLAQVVKLSDRQLARLVSPHQSNGLPANLSGPEALSKCAFKGVQIQAGMFEVYASLLSVPVTTFFGVHEEGNQDITTHALTSGILGLELLSITRYALAQHLLALAQAVDLRGGEKKLAPATRPLYRLVRSRCARVEEERPLHLDIEAVHAALTSGEAGRVLRDEVFASFEDWQLEEPVEAGTISACATENGSNR
jgi:histidine ammonia-lyase/phenylalanine ammonia-lyase